MIRPLKISHQITGALALILGALTVSAYEQGTYFIYDAMPAKSDRESDSETKNEVTATGRLPAPASLRIATTDAANKPITQTTATPMHPAFTLEQGAFGSSVFNTFESAPSAPESSGFGQSSGLLDFEPTRDTTSVFGTQ